MKQVSWHRYIDPVEQKTHTSVKVVYRLMARSLQLFFPGRPVSSPPHLGEGKSQAFHGIGLPLCDPAAPPHYRY